MKKKLIVLVCLSILIIGCKNQVTTLPAQEENNEVVSEKEVSLLIKDGTLSKKGVTLILKNDLDEEVDYGASYAIEKNNGGKWEKLDGSLDFVLVLYKLEAHKSAELELDWEKGYGILDSGTYRIIKQISYKNANDDYKTIDVAAEFVIK